MKICKRTQTHGCVHTSMSAIFTKIKSQCFSYQIFSSLIIFILFALFLCLHSPTKDNTSFPPRLPLLLLLLLPSLFCIFPSPSFRLHLDTFLCFLLLGFSSFPSSSSVFSPSAPSLFSCSIPHIPVGFIRGRTPLADQGQTLLQCSQPLSVALSVSLILSVLFFSPRLSPKPHCSGPLILFLTFL